MKQQKQHPSEGIPSQALDTLEAIEGKSNRDGMLKIYLQSLSEDESYLSIQDNLGPEQKCTVFVGWCY